MFQTIIDSPLGQISIGASLKGVSFVSFDKIRATPNNLNNNKHLTRCVHQLGEYFAGARRDFSLSFDRSGSEFQMKVWDALCEIPYGETRSYKDIALSIGNPKAVRAVGGANNKNPLAIVVPCHRVVNADGSLGGYASGCEHKEWLLEHEKS